MIFLMWFYLSHNFYVSYEWVICKDVNVEYKFTFGYLKVVASADGVVGRHSYIVQIISWELLEVKT